MRGPVGWLQALLAAALLTLASAARAEERILFFRSDVTVQRDGALLVTETIRVNVEGDRIRRGIFRDFPTRYQRAGETVRVGFDVQEVQRDGLSEPWATERLGNGIRVRIGDPEIDLKPGGHTYTIRYRTTRQLGHFPSFDELYWNATGNAWEFPIDAAQVRIRLPAPARFGQRAVYTGLQGSTARDAEVMSEGSGEIAFRTTRRLEASEGLTVAAAFPKNIVEAPAPRSAETAAIQEQLPRAFGLIGLLGVLGYYFHAWRKAGRGPVAGTIVPIFSPPDDLSAAAVRYVSEMGYDNRVFAAALVQAGVAGTIRLVETDAGGLFSGAQTQVEKTGSSGPLPDAERGMIEALFRDADTVALKQSNHQTFSRAQKALQGGLAKAHDGKAFVGNISWALFGFLVIGAALALAALVVVALDPYADPGALPWPIMAVGAYAAAVLLGRTSRIGRKDGGVGRAVLASVLALLALCATGLALMFAAEADGGAWAFLPLLGVPVAISSLFWMAAPTKSGRALMDRIAGFRHYLDITEEDRLDTLHPPEKTPELFERYLPYAIALEVENGWADKFEGVLQVASATPDQRRNGGMGWYSGSKDPWSDPGRFAKTMGGALASTVASASSAPGSSSGSGGGGSAGGGGGGGGGGGW